MASETININLSTEVEIKQYIEIAADTIYKWEPSLENKFWWTDPFEIIKYRALLIRDFILSNKISSHFDSDFKTRFWIPKDDTDDTIDSNNIKKLRNEFKRSFKHFKEICGFPCFYDIINSNTLLPNQIVEKSLSRNGQEFRKWFFEFFDESKTDAVILKSLIKELWSLMEVKNTKSSILKWGAFNLISLLPIVGPTLSATASLTDIIQEIHKKEWKPILFLKSII